MIYSPVRVIAQRTHIHRRLGEGNRDTRGEERKHCGIVGAEMSGEQGGGTTSCWGGFSNWIQCLHWS